MLKHAIAHEGCKDTVGESALKVELWRKIPCGTGELNLPQRRAGSTLYQLSYIPSLEIEFFLYFHFHFIGIVWEPIRKQAHMQLFREHSATVVFAR